MQCKTRHAGLQVRRRHIRGRLSKRRIGALRNRSERPQFPASTAASTMKPRISGASRNRSERRQFQPRSAAVHQYGEHRRLKMQSAVGLSTRPQKKTHLRVRFQFGSRVRPPGQCRQHHVNVCLPQNMSGKFFIYRFFMLSRIRNLSAFNSCFAPRWCSRCPIITHSNKYSVVFYIHSRNIFQL